MEIVACVDNDNVTVVVWIEFTFIRLATDLQSDATVFSKEILLSDVVY